MGWLGWLKCDCSIESIVLGIAWDGGEAEAMEGLFSLGELVSSVTSLPSINTATPGLT
jgi:hypothetical protein